MQKFGFQYEISPKALLQYYSHFRRRTGTLGDMEIWWKYSGCLSGKCRKGKHKESSSMEADS